MTKNEIELRINQLNTEAGNSLYAMIYFILQKGNNFEIVLADIDQNLQPEIATVWMKSMQENLNDDEKTVINLSSADNRKNVIYQYDLEEYTQLLEMMKNPISNETRKFDFRNDNFDEIFGFIIKIGLANNNFSIFRKNYPISLISKDKSFNLSRTGDHHRLVKINEDILKINFQIDFFIIDGLLFICNLNVLERYFNFHEVIKNQAQKSIEIIEESGLLEDIEPLKASLENTSFARKLIRITTGSQVISKIPNNVIIDYTKTNSVLKGKFSYNASGDKIVLTTKKARDYFLKIMNDDILISELTKNYYDSLAKDIIQTEE